MGCLTLSFYKKSLTLLIAFFSLGAFALEIEGVKIPDKITCEGKEIPLSGAGLRTATFLKVRVFVLAVYAPTKILKGKGAELDQRPMCFEMTYLREFDNEDVDKAWDYQFKESSTHDYPGLKDHVKDVKKYFGEIKGDRKESFSLVEGTTKVYENGELKGEIKGEDFQKSFLSIWFGPNPPTKHLQESILNEGK